MKKKLLYFLVIISVIVSVMIISGCNGGPSGAIKKMTCREVTKYRTEEYTVTKEYKGCDSEEGCVCTHERWGGLGSCDTCRCTKTRQVAYKEEVCE